VLEKALRYFIEEIKEKSLEALDSPERRLPSVSEITVAGMVCDG